MIVTLRTERIRTIEQLAAFVQANEPARSAAPGPAGLRARGHRPPGRARRRQGGVPHQPRRRGHAVRVRRRRRGSVRALPGAGARGAAGPVPVRGPGLSRRQRPEYVNHAVAEPLAKLHVGQFTKSRPRRSTDNALVEGKNASVVRRFLGREHIPRRFAALVHAFTQDCLSPYLNYPRPCLFATERKDERGRIRRIYRLDDLQTPYEKLRSLPQAQAASSPECRSRRSTPRPTPTATCRPPERSTPSANCCSGPSPKPGARPHEPPRRIHPPRAVPHPHSCARSVQHPTIQPRHPAGSHKLTFLLDNAPLAHPPVRWFRRRPGKCSSLPRFPEPGGWRW